MNMLQMKLDELMKQEEKDKMNEVPNRIELSYDLALWYKAAIAGCIVIPNESVQTFLQHSITIHFRYAKRIEITALRVH